MLLGNHFMKTYKRNPQDSKKCQNKTKPQRINYGKTGKSDNSL